MSEDHGIRPGLDTVAVCSCWRRGSRKTGRTTEAAEAQGPEGLWKEFEKQIELSMTTVCEPAI